MHERGSSRHIFILILQEYRSNTHTQYSSSLRAKQRGRRREREAERREALFFLSTIKIRRRCGNKNDSSSTTTKGLFFLFFCSSFLRRCSL